jgi:hypothetical protein
MGLLRLLRSVQAIAHQGLTCIESAVGASGTGCFGKAAAGYLSTLLVKHLR